jgi:hypothetical protein
MTILEMHTLADLLIDKANAPWFNATEKDRFINMAINEYTKNKYAAFEVDEKVREDLLTLVLTNTTLDSSTINLDTVPNFLFVLRLEMDVNSPCGILTNVPITPMRHDVFVESRRDPFNKPADKYPQYTQSVVGGARTITIFSDTVPTAVRMVYLAQPATVSITVPTNCNLPVHTHEEIVNLAVRKMLGTIEAFQNYQVQTNEIKNQE